MNINDDSSLCKVKSGLYIISTPIGNLDDITLRALSTLKSMDIILCEDTRVSKKLLHHFQIQKPLHSFHDHNESQKLDFILESLRKGLRIGLISDAGTPLISDPGYKIVKLCANENILVIPIPGPSSILAALVGAGVSTDSFFYGGFLPPKDSQRKTYLEKIIDLNTTFIFLEAPHRLISCLEGLRSVFPDCYAVVARELTKTFETFHRGLLSELIYHFSHTPPRGECVIIIEKFENERKTDLFDLISMLLKENSFKEAVEIACKIYGFSKKESYQMALKIKDSQEPF